MAGHCWPWPAHCQARWPAMAGHAQPWPAMASHGCVPVFGFGPNFLVKFSVLKHQDTERVSVLHSCVAFSFTPIVRNRLQTKPTSRNKLGLKNGSPRLGWARAQAPLSFCSVLHGERANIARTQAALTMLSVVCQTASRSLAALYCQLYFAKDTPEKRCTASRSNRAAWDRAIANVDASATKSLSSLHPSRRCHALQQQSLHAILCALAALAAAAVQVARIARRSLRCSS